VGAAPPVIALRGVERVYTAGGTPFYALGGVSLEVERGEFVAIMGQSGSGKSTLMNIIGCLDRPTKGTYHLAGRDVATLDADARAVLRNQLLGFIFQGFNLLPRTNALENVETPLVYSGVPGAERTRRATRSLTLVGLADRLKSTAAQLSGGQQQRVATARALVTSPEVLLADEPTGNLDTRTAEEVLALLQWLNRERGLTIVMVTHDANVAACATRVVTVSDGHIVSDTRATAPRQATPAEGAVLPWLQGGARAEVARAPVGVDRPRVSLAITAYMAFGLALRALARSKLRASLTALGILIGIAAVVTTSALGAGAQERMAAQLTSLGVNLLVVVPSGVVSGGARGAQGAAVTLNDDDAEAIARELPTVGAVAPMLGAGVQVVVGALNWSTRVTGTTPGYFAVRTWPAALGALWGAEEVRTSARVCAIGETVRRQLFGAADPIGRDLRVGRMPCTVVAVLAVRGQTGFGQDQDDTVVIPISAFRAGIYRLPNLQVNNIMVTARGPDVLYRAQAGVTELLRQRHHTRPGEDDDFSVRNLTELMNSFKAQQAIITALLLVVASISLLVGGIGVMNIMLVSVTERTREIGVRLAIGARRRDVLAQFMIEAVVLSAIGGLAGLLLGVGAGAVLGRVTQFSVRFQPDAALLAMAVSCGIGLVFGFFPARRAARLDPIDALRRE
jgi:macrolide transport system ATP-binding/permease protein